MLIVTIARCVKGDPLRFRVRAKGIAGQPSISTLYDVAKFEARASANDTDASIVLRAGTADGSITINAPDPDTGDIFIDVVVDRIQTEATGVLKPTSLFGRIRLYQSGDPTQSISKAVPVEIYPDPIANG